MADEKTDTAEADNQENDAVYGVTVNLSAILGTAELKVEQVLRLGRGAVVELERGIGEPIDLLADGQLVARGEVVVVNEMLAIQVTEIIKKSV